MPLAKLVDGGLGLKVFPATGGTTAIVSDASLHGRAIGISNKIYSPIWGVVVK
jgi:hypothetical protein